MTKQKFKINYKKLLLIFLSILAIILIFYFLDRYVHSQSPDYAVPDYYFQNKIIYGLIWGLVIYYFIRKLNILSKGLIFSAFISLTLQIRYYLEGYPKIFVFEFLIFHFIMLTLASLIIFKLMNRWIKSS